MKRLSVYLITTMICFAIGVTANFAWHPVGKLSKNEAPAPPVKVCEVHRVVMSLEPTPVLYRAHTVLNITEVYAQQQWFPLKRVGKE
jgi:hypothetical protein